MKKALKQSIKERLRVLAKERNLTFAEIWHFDQLINCESYTCAIYNKSYFLIDQTDRWQVSIQNRKTMGYFSWPL